MEAKLKKVEAAALNLRQLWQIRSRGLDLALALTSSLTLTLSLLRYETIFKLTQSVMSIEVEDNISN